MITGIDNNDRRVVKNIPSEANVVSPPYSSAKMTVLAAEGIAIKMTAIFIIISGKAN